MYKEATRLGLRFKTALGHLSIEQLWTLTLTQLDTIAVELEETSSKSVRRSFISDISDEDKIEELKFNIVLDILKTKLNEQHEQRMALETKAHNQKILSIIADKQEEGLKNMDIESLEKMLK